MFTNAKTLFVLLWLCCCCSAPDGTAVSHHKHARTRSGSSHQPRKESLTADMPLVNIQTSTTINSGRESIAKTTTTKLVTAKNSTGVNRSGASSVLRDYLFHKSSNIFRSLMRSGVGVVQRSMDAFEGVSSKVFQVARKKIAESRSLPTMTSIETRSSSVGDVKSPVIGSTAVVVKKPNHGLVKGFGKSVAKIIDTGIAGMEQITDLGLLLGNIGTHKIRAKLDGQNGNHEIFNLLVKYVSSRFGKSTQGNAHQMIDDIGIISVFVNNNDDVTRSISIIMEKFMNDPKVSAAIVRLVISLIKSSPSTSCLLDRLPLSPEDIRMAFNVFVGSSGLEMLKTIAGLLSELTTGPDAKEFLESALGMASMLKSDNPTTSNPTNPVSVVGSFTSFFTGGDDEEDDEGNPIYPHPSLVVKNKSDYSSNGNDKKTKPKPPPKRATKSQEDNWFIGDSVFNSPKKKKSNQLEEEDDWFGGSIRSKPKSGLSEKGLKSKTKSISAKNEIMIAKTKTNSEKKNNKKRKQPTDYPPNSGGYSSGKAFFDDEEESSGN